MGPPSEKRLSKKQRNRIAQKKCRAKQKLVAQETKNKVVHLEQQKLLAQERENKLVQQVSTLKEKNQQLQSQLEQFREMFSKQNMSSVLMSSLCVICAVICVFAPCTNGSL